MATKKTKVKSKAKSATNKAKSTKNIANSVKTISEEDIRNRAQKIYETRVETNRPGDSISDWKQAEKELGVKK